ncbi:dihydrofolate reductase [Kurthia sp. Dielmo]|uniref:dihydrofolate reductase n=1 Tax=Kurthia sp. Dielmo TaxID=1033738 RepID=UPI0011230E5E|nr:dihydrofolate reductase [Kurthia sp. Dielmo]
MKKKQHRNITMIVAHDKAYGIGYEGRILWDIPEDRRFFKEQTTNGVVIMGRKTFESLNKPLPNRMNVIVTHNRLYNVNQPNCIVFNSLMQALDYARRESIVVRYPKGTFIIGGGEIYKKALPFVHDCLVTHVENTYLSDTKFPESYKSMFPVETELGTGDGYRFVKHTRS